MSKNLNVIPVVEDTVWFISNTTKIKGVSYHNKISEVVGSREEAALLLDNISKKHPTARIARYTPE